MVKTAIIPLCAIVLLSSLAARAGVETEGVLIRQALEKERFGKRRGDVELMVGVYAPNFVVYDGGGAADAMGWTVVHESGPSYAAALEDELTRHRHDVIRLVPFLKVIESVAVVTTVDSGEVIDRASGTRRPYRMQGLWTFRKVEEDWLATSFVSNVGDSTLGPFTGSQSSGSRGSEVMDALQAEAEAWNGGDAGSVAGFLDEDFVAYDAYDKWDPATWLIIFSNPLEFRTWLDRRFDLTDYQIERQIVHLSIGSDGNAAIAVTADKVSTSHRLGSATHRRDRHVLWTLSRRSGDWKATNMILNTRHRN